MTASSVLSLKKKGIFFLLFSTQLFSSSFLLPAAADTSVSPYKKGKILLESLPKAHEVSWEGRVGVLPHLLSCLRGLQVIKDANREERQPFSSPSVHPHLDMEPH